MNLEDYLEFLSPEDIRLKGHRIGIETILLEYLDGLTPEEIALRHPTLSLEEVYATITYYWRNRPAMEIYLREAEEHEAQGLRDQEDHPSPAVGRLRALIHARHARQLAA